MEQMIQINLDLTDSTIQSARFTQLALSQTSNLNNKQSIKHNNNSNRMLQWKIEWKHDTGKIHEQNNKTLDGTFKG